MSKEIDADIERMLAVHRNRKTLGFSYYETTGRKQALPVDAQLVRDGTAARQRLLRARRRALRDEPGL